MQAVYVIANRHKDQGLRCAREMVQRLHERKIQVYAPDEIAAELGVQTAAFSQEEGCEAAFVLGGDGTILRAVQRLSILQTPMVGLNLGSLGFLTEASQGAMPEIVDKVLGRAFSVESRMMLTAHIEEKTGQVVSREYYALNEFGLFRRYMGGVASVVVRYQNQVVGMYDCDGVMVEKARDTFRFRDTLRYCLSDCAKWFRRKRFYVTVNGRRVRMLGHVGLNHTTVDVTEIECQPGAKAVFEVSPMFVPAEIPRRYIE